MTSQTKWVGRTPPCRVPDDLYPIGRDCGCAKTINRHTLLDDTESFVPDDKHDIGLGSQRTILTRLIPMVKGERCEFQTSQSLGCEGGLVDKSQTT